MQAVNKLTVFMPQQEAATVVNSPSEENDFLFVKSGKQVHKIEYDAICYLEALKEYIAIHTETEKILVYKRMKEVAEQLPPQFVRIHNSYIVNLRHIKNIESNLVIVKAESLPVSNGYRSVFQEKIQSRLL
jgi:two-component system LytT family response regulator